MTDLPIAYEFNGVRCSKPYVEKVNGISSIAMYAEGNGWLTYKTIASLNDVKKISYPHLLPQELRDMVANDIINLM